MPNKTRTYCYFTSLAFLTVRTSSRVLEATDTRIESLKELSSKERLLDDSRGVEKFE